MIRRSFVPILLLVLTLLIVSPAIAQNQQKALILTVNEPVAIPGGVLGPGEYHLRFIDQSFSIAALSYPDGEAIGTYIVAHGTQTLEPADEARVIIGRLENGRAAIHEWFYPGDYVAHKFLYEAAPIVIQ